ncbi:hypothetical protein IIO_05117 [Bacillus cereus VD115]|nr:hypothetical protein IIO_05117 [Bacillus cereus VD115]
MITAQQVGAIKLNIKKLATLRKVDEDTIKGHLCIKEVGELTLKQAEEVLKKSTKWVWKGARNEKEARVKAIEYITPDRYPGYKVIKVQGDIAVCERANA